MEIIFLNGKLEEDQLPTTGTKKLHDHAPQVVFFRIEKIHPSCMIMRRKRFFFSNRKNSPNF